VGKPDFQPEIELIDPPRHISWDFIEGEYNSILAASAFSRRLKPTIIFRQIVYYWTVIPTHLAYVKLTN
jgi:hypothetical protein